jgi:hypothetical protein
MAVSMWALRIGKGVERSGWGLVRYCPSICLGEWRGLRKSTQTQGTAGCVVSSWSVNYGRSEFRFPSSLFSDDTYMCVMKRSDLRICAFWCCLYVQDNPFAFGVSNKDLVYSRAANCLDWTESRLMLETIAVWQLGVSNLQSERNRTCRPRVVATFLCYLNRILRFPFYYYC